ncbi:MAG: twitch domain-containing radical SAM protein, partial [Bdellovibrionales bacterium]|nr:twitch domain-containing radical SAM protein [Bdellovibrionales bacterium]
MGSKSTFCVLPWLQLSCKTNGAIRTCGYARVTSGGQPNLGREEVSSAWNSDYFKTIRRSMLAGDKPPNCAKCYYRESHGGTSRRQKENLAWLAELTEERAKALTRPDGSIDTPPVLLDVRTGNVCNLKCVTCFPTNSTKWLEDKDLLGKYENTLNYDVLPAWDQADGPAWRFVREFGKSLKKISFLGGEPLASLLHHSILDSLIEQQAFQVSLKYVTNGTLLKPELLDKWAKFDSVQ